MENFTHRNVKGYSQTTVYGFACGYTQGRQTDTFDKTLFREHNMYHVQSIKNNVPELNSDFGGTKPSHSYTIWESFSRLTDARKFYAKIH